MSGNTSTDSGGAVFAQQYGSLELSNSIVLGNGNPGGSELSGTGDINYSGLSIVGEGADTDPSDRSINASAADVFADTVIFADGTVAGKLADNGGPVETIALKLDGTNVAVDAATTDNGGVIEPTDARSEDAFDAPAVANGAGNSSGRDIGAYELLDDEPVITLVSDTQIQFTDTDAHDSHTASMAVVAVIGDDGVLGGADTFDFLMLDPVDQATDTVDWIFDLPQTVEDSVAAGLEAGETIMLDYTVVIADELGQTDETVLSFTLDDEGMLV